MGRSIKECDLCELSVGEASFSRKFGDTVKGFCCLGCLNVYTILSESGVITGGQDFRDTEVFKRSLALGLISRREEEAVQSFELPPDAPVKETLLHVSGMWCGACAWLIEHSVRKEPGVINVEAFFVSDMVKVKYCPLYLPPEKIAKRIEQLGYKTRDFDADDNRVAKKEARDLMIRIGVAGFLWLNIMDLSVPLYVGLFEEIAPSVRSYFPLLLMALATPVVAYSAQPIFERAWCGLRTMTIRMETLLSSGILAAYLYSAVQAFRGSAHVYFDTAAAIVTLVLLGKLIEKGAKNRATRAISTLYRLAPKKARVFVDGSETLVSVDALKCGDVFVVKAGESVPADGIIVEGETHADESLLTGESTPISKSEGDTVISGSVNAGNVIQVRAKRTGEDTTLAHIIKQVEHALGSRSELELTVDKVSKVFVPGVIVTALITFAVSFGFSVTSTEEALMRAITVLVIACPCALGLATPLAVTAAVGLASRHGILVRDASILEKIRDLDAVVFDKTGTITAGRFELLDVALERNESNAPAFASAAGFSIDPRRAARTESFDSDYLPLLAGIERYSEHPLGAALIRYAEQRLVPAKAAIRITIDKGLGISGYADGKKVLIGSRRLIERLNLLLDSSLAEKVELWESFGFTVAYFVIDGNLRGAIAFGDSIRPEAVETVENLKQRNIRTIILSGDAEATTEFVATHVRVNDFRAGAMPAEKTEYIAQLQRSGLRVAMIGDGINDAPALAQADLGVAMGSGTDIAMQAADLVLIRGSLKSFPIVLYLSKRTRRIIRQNLFWAFIYNTLGIGLAVTGILSPITAALAMLLSSVSVIGNSMRLDRTPIKTPPTEKPD